PGASRRAACTPRARPRSGPRTPRGPAGSASRLHLPRPHECHAPAPRSSIAARYGGVAVPRSRLLGLHTPPWGAPRRADHCAPPGRIVAPHPVWDATLDRAGVDRAARPQGALDHGAERWLERRAHAAALEDLERARDRLEGGEPAGAWLVAEPVARRLAGRQHHARDIAQPGHPLARLRGLAPRAVGHDQRDRLG